MFFLYFLVHAFPCVGCCNNNNCIFYNEGYFDFVTIEGRGLTVTIIHICNIAVA